MTGDSTSSSPQRLYWFLGPFSFVSRDTAGSYSGVEQRGTSDAQIMTFGTLLPLSHTFPWRLDSLSEDTTLLPFNLQAPRFLYIGQAFRCSPEKAFYIFNQQIYFII